jgi:hypothetical protein
MRSKLVKEMNQTDSGLRYLLAVLEGRHSSMLTPLEIHKEVCVLLGKAKVFLAICEERDQERAAAIRSTSILVYRASRDRVLAETGQED